MERRNTQAVRRAAVLLLGLLVVISVFCGAAAAADSNLVSNVTLHSTGGTGTPASVSTDGSAAGGSDWGSVTVQNCLRGQITYVSGPTEILAGTHNDAVLSTTYSGVSSVRGASVGTKTTGAESTLGVDIDGPTQSLSYQTVTLDHTQTSWTYTHPSPVVKETLPRFRYGINLLGQSIQTADFVLIPAMTSASSDANKNTVTDSHISASTAANANQTFNGRYGIYIAYGAVSGTVVTDAASASSYLYLPNTLSAANAAGDSIEVIYYGIQNIQGASITTSGTGAENTLKLDPDGGLGLIPMDITTNRSDTAHHCTFPTPVNLAISEAGLSASNILQTASKTYTSGISISRMGTAIANHEYDNVVKNGTISGSTRAAGYGFTIPAVAAYLMPEDTAVNVDVSSSTAVYGKVAESSISAAVTNGTPKVTFTFNLMNRQGASVKTASVGAARGDITLIPDPARAADKCTLAIDGTSPYVYYYGGLGPFTPTASYPVAALGNVNVSVTPSSINVTNVANIVSATTVTAGGTAKAGNWNNNDGTEAAAQGIQTTKTDLTDIATGSITDANQFTYISGVKATYEADPDDGFQRIYTAVNVRGSIVRLESNTVKACLAINPDISPVPYTGSVKDVVYAYDEESGIRSLSFKQAASLVGTPEKLKLYNGLSETGITIPFAIDTVHTHDGVVFSNVLNMVTGITAGDYTFAADGRYYLGSNLNLSGTLIVPAGVDVKICLNGHTINANESKPAFNVNGGKLTIYADGVSKVGTIAAKGNAEAVTVTSGEFTLNSGVIKAASSNAVTVTGGELTVTGGTIDGNNAAADAVSVTGGNLTIESGKVTGFIGTAVNVAAGTFTMKGGDISGNTGDNAVCVKNGAVFKVEGTPVIKGNTAENISLETGAKITIAGDLKDGAELCVNTSAGAAAGTAFTSGWNTYMSDENPAQYFKADDTTSLAAVNAGEVFFKAYDGYKLLAGTKVNITSDRVGYSGAADTAFGRLANAHAAGEAGIITGYNASGNFVLDIPVSYGGSNLQFDICGTVITIPVEARSIAGVGTDVTNDGEWNGSIGDTLCFTMTQSGAVKYVGIPAITRSAFAVKPKASEIEVKKDGAACSEYTTGIEADGCEEIILTSPAASSVYTYTYTGSKKLGDANSDGYVDVADASSICYSLVNDDGSFIPDIYMDSDKNGYISGNDARRIALYDIGLTV